MSKRTVEYDEPLMDEQSQALQNAVERAERAEAELAKLKHANAGHHTGTHNTHKAHTDAVKHADTKHADTKHADAKHDSHRHDAKPVSSDDAEAIAPRNTSSTARPDPTGEHLIEPGSMDARKQPAAHSPEGHAVGDLQTHGLEALRGDTMMAYLLDSLDEGKDIGHYGRLTFAMIARHFLTDDEVIAELTKDNDFSEDEAKQMLMQVEGRDYSPPRRERIMEWQAEQDFPIIPHHHDPDCGNVYKSLRFPKQTYSHIGHYQQEKAES